MYKIPSVEEVIASYKNNDKSLGEVAADLGATILEIEHEKEYYGEHTQRIWELKKLVKYQEALALILLDESTHKNSEPKIPILKIVK